MAAKLDGSQLLEHFETYGLGEGRSFSTAFDVNYYRSNYSDLVAAGLKNQQLYDHFQIYGIQEGRASSPVFNVRNYISDANNFDLRAFNNSQGYNHYVSYGSREGRFGGADYAGNTLDTARNITVGSTTNTFRDFVGSNDPNDYYRFNLSVNSNLDYSLSGLGANANVELLNSSGSLLQSRILSSLEAGTYYIRVSPGEGNVNTSYYVSLAANEVPVVDTNEVPVLKINTSLQANRGTTVTINNIQLNVTDSDNSPAQLTYTLVSAPTTNATLQLNNTALTVGSTFTQQDINNGLLTYLAGSTTTQLTNNDFDDNAYNFQVVGSDVFWSGFDGNDNEMFRYDGSTVTQLTNNNTNDNAYNFQVVGSNVFWESGGFMFGGNQIFHYDGSTTTQLTDNNFRNYNLRTIGSSVVWSTQGYDSTTQTSINKIYAYNGSMVTPLTNNSRDDYFSMVGSQAIWSSFDGTDKEIYTYDGTTVTQLTDNNFDDSNVRIFGATADKYNGFYWGASGSTAVWSSFDGNDNELFLYNGSEITQLTENNFNDDSAYNFQVVGSNLFWLGKDGTDYELFRYDGSATSNLTSNIGNVSNFQVVGSNVFWNGYDGNDYEIFRYDSSTVTQLTNNNINQGGYNFQVVGLNVFWEGYINNRNQIFHYDGSTTTQLTDNNGYHSNLRIVGSNAIWHTNQGYDSIAQTNVGKNYAYDGSTVIPLTNNSRDDYFSMVGSQAIWSSFDGNDNEIYTYNGTTVTQLTDNNFDDSNVQVFGAAADNYNGFYWGASGSTAVWSSFDGNDNELFRYDGSTITQLTDNNTDDSIISAQDSNIFWRGFDGTDYELFSYNDAANNATSDNISFTVTDGSGGSISTSTFNISVSPKEQLNGTPDEVFIPLMSVVPPQASTSPPDGNSNEFSDA